MVQLNDRELKLLVIAFETAEAELKIDFQAMAEKAGYRDKATASTMWSRLKRKIVDKNPPSSSAAATGSATSGSKKRGRAKKVADESAEDEDKAVTKRQKKTASTKKEKCVDENIEEEEGRDELDLQLEIKDEESS